MIGEEIFSKAAMAVTHSVSRWHSRGENPPARILPPGPAKSLALVCPSLLLMIIPSVSSPAPAARAAPALKSIAPTVDYLPAAIRRAFSFDQRHSRGCSISGACRPETVR